MRVAISAESTIDLPKDLLAEWDIHTVPFTIMMGNDTYLDGEIEPTKLFEYADKSGKLAKTSAVNEDAFENLFTPFLEAGMDILYLGFSSGLSVTCENGKKVANALSEKYPERKIRVIDSLAASAGQGLFVYLGKTNRDSGMSLDENADALEADKLHICHWFTVEDLKYLKRGGRISAATALLGTALNVKPVLHVDNEGHLIKVTQVHGRKKSIRTMAEKLGGSILDGSPIFISQADCMEDAEKLKEILKEAISDR